MMELEPGLLCVADFPFVATAYSSDTGSTAAYHMIPGDVFVLLEAVEIDELSVIEVQILFENRKMWFNIHNKEYNIGSVRRAGSYDIPFMTLQEFEPGSKLAL